MLVTGLSIGLGYRGLGYGYHGLPVIAAAAETAEETVPNQPSRAVNT